MERLICPKPGFLSLISHVLAESGMYLHIYIYILRHEFMNVDYSSVRASFQERFMNAI